MTERVLVLERIEGRKIEPEHGRAPEVARDLAHEFFRAYVHQVTVEGVYHADPHLGNVPLTPDNRLALLDFGLLGRLDDDTRRGLSLLLLGKTLAQADSIARAVPGARSSATFSASSSRARCIRSRTGRWDKLPLLQNVK